MDAVGILMGVLVAIGLGIAVRNRYWGAPKPEHEKISVPVSDPLLSYDWQKRLQAIHDLAKHPGDDAKNRLLGMMSDKDEDVREAARSALLTYGAESLNDFIHLLGQGDNHDARCEAAIALRAYSCDDAVEALIGAMHDDSRFVRLAIAESLAFCHDSRAREALAQLRQDEYEAIRAVVITALGKA